jgi:serine/threonine protein kinase
MPRGVEPGTAPAQTVEGLCNTLARHGLLPPEEVRKLYQRWKSERPSGDVPAFTRWLAENRYVTEYQAGVLGRGHAESLLLGPYTVIERIGRGRMAGVYRAVHRLGQVVAVKVLPPSKAKDPTTLARFEREARLSVKLNHPNIVRTFQVGQHQGLHYLVMEYLEGETLEDVLKRRRLLPPAEAVRLVYQVLLGLQHLNDKNMVHRDIKPGNLMLVPASASGPADTTLQSTIKVLDIGVGRALFDEDAPGGNFELTNEGDLLGAPEYMAPEQARDARTVDIRADIYSAGCVLYHALAGQPPFVDTSRVRLLVRQATEAPRPVRDLNPAVPNGLQQILDWMLAKDPAQRYPTPDRAASALQIFLAAGSELKPKADEQLRAYLQWLDSNDPQAVEAPAAQAAIPASIAPPPNVEVIPELMAAPEQPPLPRPRPAAPSRPARPAPAAAPPAKKKPIAADVELVAAEDEPSTFQRRDYMLLALGAGVVLGIALVGLLVYLLLQ